MGLFGPDADKVVAKGTPTSAIITGLQCTYVSTEDTTRRDDAYALAIDGGPTVGVRQQLSPDVYVRLGMRVAVRVLGTAAVIDWASTCASFSVQADNHLHRWKSLKEPPATGIVDEEQQLERLRKKGQQGMLTVRAVQQRSVMFGLGTATDLDAVVAPAGGQPYAVELGKVHIAHYASHLAVAGATLPCWIDAKRPDRVVVDWPSAAMQFPGVGIAPAVAPPSADAEPVAGAGQPIDVVADVAAATGSGELNGGISLATLVAVEVGLINDRVAPGDSDRYAQRHGVAPGTWATAVSEWNARKMSDWRVGAAYGEAFEAERKRQKQQRKGG